MKLFTIFCVVWIASVCSPLSVALPQVGRITTNAAALFDQTNLSSEYRQPGDVLLRMANATNAPVVAVPFQDKIQVWTDALQNILIGAGTIVTSVLLLWGRLMQLRASVVPTLIQTVEAHGTDALKGRIEQAALRAGVEPQLRKAVKEHTVSDGNPFPPTPVVEAPKTTDIRPI